MDTTIKNLLVALITGGYLLGAFLLVSAAYSGRFELGKYRQIDKRTVQERRNLLILGLFFIALTGFAFVYLHKHGSSSNPAPSRIQQMPRAQPPSSPRIKPNPDLILSPPKSSDNRPRVYSRQIESPTIHLPRNEKPSIPQNSATTIPPVKNEPPTTLPKSGNETSGAPYSFPDTE